MKSSRWFFVIPPAGAARWAAQQATDAFRRKLGSENCKTFDSQPYEQAFGKLLRSPDPDMIADLLNQSLVVSSLDFAATHLMVYALAPVTLFTLKLLRKQGLRTIHWFYEDFRRATYWRDILGGYAHFLAIQEGPLPEACRQSGSEFHFVPTACSTPVQGPTLARHQYDIGFVGIPSAYRVAVLQTLADEGFSVAIAGQGWDSISGSLKTCVLNDSWTSPHQQLAILEQCRIGVNLSVDEPNDRQNTHISPRVFDIVTAQCVMITEDVPLLRKVFPGCHAHVFSDPAQLPSLCRRILANYASERELAEADCLAVRNHHTYDARVESIVSLVQ